MNQQHFDTQEELQAYQDEYNKQLADIQAEQGEA